jgi:hypothetical protein
VLPSSPSPSVSSSSPSSSPSSSGSSSASSSPSTSPPNSAASSSSSIPQDSSGCGSQIHPWVPSLCPIPLTPGSSVTAACNCSMNGWTNHKNWTTNSPTSLGMYRWITLAFWLALNPVWYAVTNETVPLSTNTPLLFRTIHYLRIVCSSTLSPLPGLLRSNGPKPSTPL